MHVLEFYFFLVALKLYFIVICFSYNISIYIIPVKILYLVILGFNTNFLALYFMTHSYKKSNSYMYNKLFSQIY